MYQMYSYPLPKKISILRVCFLTIFTRVKLNADSPFLTQNAYFTHIRLKAYLEPRKNPLNGPQTFVSTYPPLLHSNIPHLSFVPFSKLRLLRRRCEAFFLEVAPVFPPVLMMSWRGLLFLTGGDSYEKHISSQRGLSESHLHNK